MKNFLKYTLATITGIFIASILFFVIFFVSISAMVASADKATSIDDNSVLVLNTSLPIPERGNDDPFASFDPINFSISPSPGINDILDNLERASKDEKIKGLVIENGPAMHGWAKAREIREAILKFRESGKFVIAYADFYMTQESYYISTAADKIYLNPVALLEFKGIGSEVMFYKEALAKIGVEYQVVKHGKFKGAVEPYTGSSLSPENRSQIEVFTNGIWNGVLEEISESRDISPTMLNDIANNLATSDTRKAVELNMIDGLMFRDEFLDRLTTLTDTVSGKKSERVSMVKYNNVPVSGAKVSDSKIAVVYMEGNIVMGNGNDANIGGVRYATVLRKIRESDKYSAVVIRLNSRGGVAIASDYIWREVKLLAEKMPVVVSMSNYAASGGYYLACPADAIFAQPNTLTGSIGVYGMIPQAGKLLNEKLGITTERVMTNRYADAPSFFRSMDSYEKEIMQANIDNTYNEFISRVSEGRNISIEDVDKIGQGHVYFGSDALDKKLVDYLGGLQDAIDHAAELAETESYRIVELPEIEDTYTRLIKSLGGEIRAKIVEKQLGPAAEFYNDIKEITELEGIQARMPFILKMR